MSRLAPPQLSFADLEWRRQPLEEDASVPITVIVNWPALLNKGAAAP
jgi:hypothetical protein